MEQRFGVVLAGLRKERQLSLRDLGERTTFSHVYLWQIERGEKRPTPRVAEACDRELRAGGELLALLAAPSVGPDSGGREPACSAGTPTGDGLVEDVSPRGPRPCGEAWRRFERLYRELGGVCVRPRLNEFLRTRAMPRTDERSTAPAGSVGGSGSVDPEVLGAVAALQGLAAACAHDCLDRVAAEPHARCALALAQRSGQVPMVGYALAVRARFELWAGRPEAAEVHLERAMALRSRLGPALVADVQTLCAETYARRGEAGRAHQALLESARLVECIDPDAGPQETRYVTPGALQTRRAEVLRRLGRTDEALDHARVAAVIGARGSPRARVHTLTVLGRVQADRGEPWSAAAAGVEAMDLAAGMESRLLARRLSALGRACAGADGELDERARGLLSWLS